MFRFLILFLIFIISFPLQANEEIIDLVNSKLSEIGKFQVPTSYTEGLINLLKIVKLIIFIVLKKQLEKCLKDLKDIKI